MFLFISVLGFKFLKLLLDYVLHFSVLFQLLTLNRWTELFLGTWCYREEISLRWIQMLDGFSRVSKPCIGRSQTRTAWCWIFITRFEWMKLPWITYFFHFVNIIGILIQPLTRCFGRVFKIASRSGFHFLDLFRVVVNLILFFQKFATPSLSMAFLHTFGVLRFLIFVSGSLSPLLIHLLVESVVNAVAIAYITFVVFD